MNFSKFFTQRTFVVLGITVTGLATTYLVNRYFRKKNEERDEDKKMIDDEIEQDTKDLALHYKKNGNQFFLNGEFEKAIDFYKTAIDITHRMKTETRKMCAIFHQNIAACEELLGNDSKVLEHCSTAIKLDVEYGKAYRRKSRVLAKQANYKNALFNSAVVAIMEKFECAEIMEETHRYFQMVVQNELFLIENKERYPLVERGFILQYFSKFFRDIFCYSEFVIPIIKRVRRKVELSNTSAISFQTIFAMELNSIRDDYLFGAFSDSEEITNVVERLKYFIEKLENLEDKSLEIVHNLTGALTFLGDVYFIHGRLNRSKECYDKGLSASKPFKNNEIVKLIRISILLKQSGLFLHLQKFDESFVKIDDAEQIDDQNIDVYYHRSEIFLLMNNLHAAIEMNGKAVPLIDVVKFPSDVDLEVILLAQKLYMEFKMEHSELTQMKIEIEMAKLLKKNRSNCDVLYFGIQLYKLKGDDKKMERHLEQMQRVCKNFVNFCEIQSLVDHFNSEYYNMKLMKSDVQLMLVKENNSEMLHRINSQILIQLNNLSAALIWLKKTIPLTKDSQDLRYIIHLVIAIEIQLKVIDYLRKASMENVRHISIAEQFAMKLLQEK
ncbi:hypothetical protein SNEBB_006551 [Seison nebaliae]|nr:hypothetical protein SNEBB_006551 [Seison nebaliae]